MSKYDYSQVRDCRWTQTFYHSKRRSVWHLSFRSTDPDLDGDRRCRLVPCGFPWDSSSRFTRIFPPMGFELESNSTVCQKCLAAWHKMPISATSGLSPSDEAEEEAPWSEGRENKSKRKTQSSSVKPKPKPEPTCPNCSKVISKQMKLEQGVCQACLDRIIKKDLKAVGVLAKTPAGRANNIATSVAAMWEDL